jgi:hypothetical protein
MNKTKCKIAATILAPIIVAACIGLVFLAAIGFIMFFDYLHAVSHLLLAAVAITLVGGIFFLSSYVVWDALYEHCQEHWKRRGK